jgi:hypothetical protein
MHYHPFFSESQGVKKKILDFELWTFNSNTHPIATELSNYITNRVSVEIRLKIIYVDNNSVCPSPSSRPHGKDI